MTGKEFELNELTFSEEGHIYRLDGNEIPSVSRIIEPVSQHEYGFIDASVLRRAADKGTAVHKSIETYNSMGIMDISEELRPYGQAYVDWHEKTQPKIIVSECKTYHKVMRYAGTVDCVAVIKDKVCLIDYKTSYKLAMKNYRLQLEAYVQALKSHGIEIERKIILHLMKTGKYEAVELPIKDADAWSVFGACKTIYDFNCGY